MRRQSIVRTAPPPVTAPADFFLETTIVTSDRPRTNSAISPRVPPAPIPGPRSALLDHDGSAITQDLGRALHDLGRIVPDPHDGVGPDAVRMLAHQIERLGPRPLAQLRQNRDVAAKHGLH